MFTKRLIQSQKMILTVIFFILVCVVLLLATPRTAEAELDIIPVFIGNTQVDMKMYLSIGNTYYLYRDDVLIKGPFERSGSDWFDHRDEGVAKGHTYTYTLAAYDDVSDLLPWDTGSFTVKTGEVRGMIKSDLHVAQDTWNIVDKITVMEGATLSLVGMKLIASAPVDPYEPSEAGKFHIEGELKATFTTFQGETYCAEPDPDNEWNCLFEETTQFEIEGKNDYSQSTPVISILGCAFKDTIFHVGGLGSIDFTGNATVNAFGYCSVHSAAQAHYFENDMPGSVLELDLDGEILHDILIERNTLAGVLIRKSTPARAAGDVIIHNNKFHGTYEEFPRIEIRGLGEATLLIEDNDGVNDQLPLRIELEECPDLWAGSSVHRNRGVGTVFLDGVVGLKVRWNEITGHGIYGKECGINLMEASDNEVTHNTITFVRSPDSTEFACGIGFGIIDHHDLTTGAINNLVAYNTVNGYLIGLGLGLAESNTIRDNVFTQNFVNVHVGGFIDQYTGEVRGEYAAVSNLIANNVFIKRGGDDPRIRTFEAVSPCGDGTCANDWSLDPPEAGHNILGGPWYGGNVWSDYEGEDADRDGLGDTPFELNAGNTDLHPLHFDIVVNRIGDEEDASPGNGICDIDPQTVGDQCTLRAAIMEANARQGHDVIHFLIDSDNPVFAPLSALPALSDPADMDTVTQPGGRVTVDGKDLPAGSPLIYVTAPDCTFSGLRITGSPTHGIHSESSGSLSLKNLEVDGNRGYGVLTEGDVLINVDPATQASVGNRKCTFLANGIGGEGGGVRSTAGTVTGAYIRASNNHGPGIAARSGVDLRAFEANENFGSGVQCQSGPVRIRQADQDYLEDNQALSNHGPGILSGTRATLPAPGTGDGVDGGDVVVATHIRVAENGGWGIAAPNGNVVINRETHLSQEELSPYASAVVGNGDKSKECIILNFAGDPVNLDEYDTGGIGAGRTVAATRLDVQNNAGVGIQAGGHLDYRIGTLCNNSGGDLRVGYTINLVEVTRCDADADGVGDSTEDSGSPNGDANNDGIPDRDQPNVVTLTAQGAVHVLETDPNAVLQQVAVIPAGLPPLPGGADPPLLFTFSIVPPSGTGSVTVRHIFPEGTSPASYWLFGATPDNPSFHWYAFDYDGTSGAQIDGNTVTLHFSDGLRGDGDLTANGTIAAGPVPENLLADVNGDGIEDLQDAVLLLRLLSGFPWEGVPLDSGITGDPPGIPDAIYLLQKISGAR